MKRLQIILEVNVPDESAADALVEFVNDNNPIELCANGERYLADEQQAEILS